jgi:hypothetical protein
VKELGAISIEEQLKYLAGVDRTNLSLMNQMDLTKRLYDSFMEHIDDAYNKELAAIDDAEDVFQKASDAKIATLQKQLDELESQNEELEEQEKIQKALQDIEEARLDIQKAQDKLANVKAEENTRIFKDGVWDYIANPKDVKDAQEAVNDANDRLANAEQSYYDTINGIIRDSEKKRLQEKIAAEQEAQEVALISYEQQREDLEGHLEGIKEAVSNGGEELNDILGVAFGALNLTTNTWLSEMAASVSRYCSQMRADLASISADGLFLPQYESGGPIFADQVAKLHAGEYVLNEDDVRRLGGLAGVDKARLAIREPIKTLSPNISKTSNVTNSSSRTTIDQSVKLTGPIQLPHVYDASGLIRNLRQFARN